jgi:hypothetical protein
MFAYSLTHLIYFVFMMSYATQSALKQKTLKKNSFSFLSFLNYLVWYILT